jgi:sterol desaturase/sphingolipid hydroxylase (fatty acid hydroxylase superfamily)
VEQLEGLFALVEDLIGWILSESWWAQGDFSLLRWIAAPVALIIGLVIALELLMPLEKRKWNRQHLLTLTHFVLASKVAFFSFITLPAMQWAWVRWSLPTLHLDQAIGPVSFTILALLVMSFIDYWAHRILHRVPLLWHIHKIHHAPKELTWASTFQEHFAMTITSAPMLSVSTLLMSVHLVPPWGAVHILVNYLQHGNIRLKFGWLNYVFALPEIHRYHHERDPRYYDKNFSGGFMIWDHVFRTFHYDPKVPAKNFGLDEEIPMTWHGQQIAPLKWIAQDLMKGRLGRLLGRKP